MEVEDGIHADGARPTSDAPSANQVTHRKSLCRLCMNGFRLRLER